MAFTTDNPKYLPVLCLEYVVTRLSYEYEIMFDLPLLWRFIPENVYNDEDILAYSVKYNMKDFINL